MIQCARSTTVSDPGRWMSAFSGGRFIGAEGLYFRFQNLAASTSNRSSLIGWPGRGFQLSFVCLCWIFSQPVAAQEIGKLYAARPPAGYSFVRVAAADKSSDAGKVQMAVDGVRIDDNAVASRYRAVKAGRPISISIAGTVVDTTIVPRADQFATVVVERDGSGWRGHLIDEGRSNSNDLKAQLRFFNLARGCEALLKVADGPVIFDATPVWHIRSRAINPVQARLEAACGGQNASFALPQLRAGDHFSIFLRGKSGESLDLSGQFDETEPFRDR